MKETTVKSVLFLFIGFVISIKAIGSNPEKIKSLDEQKAAYYEAKKQIEDMLSGKEPLNYGRAVFLTENAYYSNEYSYAIFQEEISVYTKFLELLADKNIIKKETDFKTDLTGNSKEKFEKYKTLVKNWVIYKFISDTTLWVDGEGRFIHYPFVYSSSDPLATNDWKNSQVTNLLFSDMATGNCYALASLFKIFAERLGTDAQIATAPNHIYIIHKDEKNITYNIELGAKAFPGNGSIETLTFLTDKAVKNDIGMRYLDLKQTVALNLVYLAKSYQKKFNTDDDSFLISCAEKVLEHDPKNLNALLLKAEITENRLFNKIDISKVKTPKDLNQAPALKNEFLVYENQIVNLYELGYLEMPVEMKNILISTYMNDNYPLIHQDHTPSASTGSVNKHDKDYITLSNGLFDEVHQPKATEKYFRVTLDTKAKKVVAFSPKDTTYNKYNFDPVLFALSIDPLAAKYPYYSPYSAFGNNPIWFVDNDGRENIVYLVYLPNKDSKITKQDAIDMAAKANENYKTMGLNTRVVVVDKAMTGGKEFDASKIDKTDAVAVVGTVGDVTNYIKKQGGGAYLEGWKGGNEPERSQNEHQYDENGNLKSYGGGKFIAIDANAVEGYGKENGWTEAEAGGQIINHGSGHNSDADLKLGHNERGVMMDGTIRQYSPDKSDKDYKTITSASRNTNFIQHIKQRFGTKQATINYNGKGTVIK